MLIITMTSWTARINNVLAVLKTVINQTVLPNTVYLNLSKTEFDGIDLPADLLTFINKYPFIKINWVDGPNTRPFKKIFPILRFLNDDDIIINIDDDMILPKTFIESRLADFKYYRTCISGIQNKINGYANGLLPEVRHYLGPGSVFQKKMFKNWDRLLNDEIIDTKHDDAFYCFMAWLNGWTPESCRKFDSFTLDTLAEHETSIHGAIGCYGPVEATRVSIKRFKEVYKMAPCYNFFKTNPKPRKIEEKKDIRADGQSNTFLYF